MADKYDLAYLNLDELPTLAAASFASGDFVIAYDASAGQFVKVDATSFTVS